MTTPDRVTAPTSQASGEELLVYFSGETQHYVFWFGVIGCILLVAIVALLVAMLIQMRRRQAGSPGGFNVISDTSSRRRASHM